MVSAFEVSDPAPPDFIGGLVQDANQNYRETGIIAFRISNSTLHIHAVDSL